MLVMVLNFEANLASLDFFANNALVLCVIENSSLAAKTLELTVILLLQFMHLLTHQGV
jgi:hypothetical protein